MSNRMLTIKKAERGITLLVTLLFMSVLLGITATLLNISLKQYKIAGIGYASEAAFQAAQAGLECALFHDFMTPGTNFDIDGDGNLDSVLVFQVSGDDAIERPRSAISCMGINSNDLNSGDVGSGDEQLFEFSWGSGADSRCTSISVYKFKDDDDAIPIEDKNDVPMRSADCPAGGECTAIKSRGYNVGCNQIGGGRVVERELTQIY